ncbi:MAG: NAD(P)/FAD-dependent oxidoreductase [Candidatus Sungbacteria bacterium]|nr:NAD(P)/FAD-dependent oxidoreductase [Candidatus Sungbacteria bacterium]
MNNYQYLIIGGGIAGVTAAETIRRHNHDATIGIIADEPYPLYSRVLLPSYLKRKIPRQKVFLRTMDDFTAQQIELRTQETVVSIDIKRKDVTLAQGASLGYNKLLIASGGHATPWGNPEDQGFIYRLHTLDDADRLFHAFATITSPLIIGSSFISLEFLEIFLANGIMPKLLSRDPFFFGSMLEESGAELLRENFERHGIVTRFNDQVARLTLQQGGFSILAKSGMAYTCDALGVGVGLTRNVNFLKESGITIGKQGVSANEFLETSSEGVFAAGDVAEYYNPLTQSHRVVGNWTSAFLQGTAAGMNMLGQREPFRAIPAYSITNLGFQITALGDCSAEEAIARIDQHRKQYERLFLRQGMLIGAVMINKFTDKAHITRLIETQTPLAPYQERLADMAFDIHEIPVLG